jgi:putative transferase (TIGR04331 family)
MQPKLYFLADGNLPKINANYYVLDVNHLIKLNLPQNKLNYIKIVPQDHKNKDAFVRASRFEKKKYQKYLKILTKEMNRVHSLNHNEIFWERVFGYTLLIHINFARQAFRIGKFISNKKVSFVVNDEYKKNIQCQSSNEVVYRKFFEYSNVGLIQLLDSYKKLFPKGFRRNLVSSHENNLNVRLLKSSNLLKSFENVLILFYKIKQFLNLDNFKSFFYNLIFFYKKKLILVLNTSWKKQNIVDLIFKSKGLVKFSIFKIKTKNFRYNKNLRELNLNSFDDKFDKFFFYTLFKFAPSTLFESFSLRYQACNLYLSRREQIKYIFSEWCDEDSLILCALASVKGIKLVGLDHNVVNYPYLGNNLWFLYNKFDLFYSMGFIDKKVTPMGSNFDWSPVNKTDNKKIRFLYVSTFCQTKYPYTSAIFSESGEVNSKFYLNQKKIFFSQISADVLRETYYRGYPKNLKASLEESAIEDNFLSDIAAKVKRFDSSSFFTVPYLISSSKLVFVDYMSTPYLQSLIANVPTVIFLSPKRYLVDSKKEFFDELIHVGVIQTDMKEAAIFINQIFESPDKWWNSDKVKLAVKRFLSKTIILPSKINESIITKLTD